MTARPSVCGKACHVFGGANATIGPAGTPLTVILRPLSQGASCRGNTGAYVVDRERRVVLPSGCLGQRRCLLAINQEIFVGFGTRFSGSSSRCQLPARTVRVTTRRPRRECHHAEVASETLKAMGDTERVNRFRRRAKGSNMGVLRSLTGGRPWSARASKQTNFRHRVAGAGGPGCAMPCLRWAGSALAWG